MEKLSALILFSLLLLLSGVGHADEQQGPRTGYFRTSVTPLELLGERGAATLAEVFEPGAKLRWQLNVPKTYDPENPPGLIVFVNRANRGGGKKVWSDVLQDKNLIWAGALDAGDEAPINERMFKAILAPTMLARTYHIDPTRVYIAGFSGGAHVAAILATTKPELFKGGLFMGGAIFWEDKTPPKIDIVRQNRFVFLAGANDVARTRVTRTADLYRKAGAMQSKLIIVPNARQELPGKSYFEAAIEFLDAHSDEEAPQNDAKSAADAIFTNARVYTVDESMPWAEAVAVKGNEIVYVGDAAGVEALAGKNTKRHDVKSRLLLPGFIDSHMHPIAGGAFATALSLNTFGTADEWVTAIADYAEANPDAPVLFGYGFLASTFGPVGPTRQLIDAVVPDKPVLIMDEGFHAAWANSAALKALNITKDTPDPVPNFSYYKRDANGDATGYLLEETAGLAMDQLDVITEEIVYEGTGIVIDILNSYGVTAAFDAGLIGYERMAKSVLDRLEKSGELTLRLLGSYRPAGPEDVADAIENTLEWGRTLKGERYHYRVLKIMDDGTVEGRTAAMFEDYQGEPGNSGETVFTQEEMNTMVVGAARNNIDVHIHALGERAIHESLNAIEVARKNVPDSTSRYALCHIEVITDQDLPRFAELDVIAQSTPLWASYDTYGEQFVSEDQFNRYWRFNSLKELGVRLSFGSDFPASGAGTMGMSPVVQIEIGHTRQDPGEPGAPVQPRESERLNVASLVRGFTIDAAYQMQMEDEIGSIEVGKKADLIVLDQNIFEIDAYDIHKTRVLLTMLDGEIVYESSTE